MNYYQITLNNLDSFDPNYIHNIMTLNLKPSDWWHYLPSTYIIETQSTAKYLADIVISLVPGLNFLITKVDINDFNGYLDKKAWEWFNQKIKSTTTYKYVPNAYSPLNDLLTGKLRTTPPKTLSELLGVKQ